MPAPTRRHRCDGGLVGGGRVYTSIAQQSARWVLNTCRGDSRQGAIVPSRDCRRQKELALFNSYLEPSRQADEEVT